MAAAFAPGRFEKYYNIVYDTHCTPTARVIIHILILILIIIMIICTTKWNATRTVADAEH
jgi:hypothetical protein